MKRVWMRSSMIAAAVVTLFLAVSWPSAVAAEQYLAAQPFADQPSELIDSATQGAEVDDKAVHRRSASPGGAVAKAINSSKVTDNAKAVPFGGAAGLPAFGIRGPTTI